MEAVGKHSEQRPGAQAFVGQGELYDKFLALSQIGQELTSSRDIEPIFANLYRHVNALMDAAVFSIDIYYPERGEIEYKFCIENGERLPNASVHINDRQSLSAVCIRNCCEIVMHNVMEEIHRYIDDVKILIGDWTSSVVYVPLCIDSRVLGCITVQSFRQSAYDDFDLVILKTLASYTAIALDNSRAYQEAAQAREEALAQHAALELAYEEIKTQNERLSQLFHELEEKKQALEFQNEHITDSLHYARRIQEAILPPKGLISERFPQSFVFYRPRDIVSGDFYFYSARESVSLIGVIDCTGHGVPGAFMSALGYSYLNQIINDRNITAPDEILRALNDSVRRTLGQLEGEEARSLDGMDVALCAVDAEAGVLRFAGANRPLYAVRNGAITEFAGARAPVGGRRQGAEAAFFSHEIPITPGLSVYIATDGFADQFGGPNKRKFMPRRLQQILLELQPCDMQEQADRLEQIFDEWRGDRPQLDDVLMIGLRF